MGWFHKTIAVLTLAATGSAFFLTVSSMNSDFSGSFRQTTPHIASVVANEPEDLSPEQESKTSDSPQVSTAEVFLEKSTITLSDEALTGSNPDANIVSTISANYEYQPETVTRELYTRTNIVRSQNHLPPLQKDIDLATLATKRSEDMLARNYFSHTTPDGCDLSCRFKASRYPSLTWGENLAIFTEFTTLTEPALAGQFITNWLASSDHRQNMLSTSFTHQGIGIATIENKILVTVLFARP